MNQHGRRLWRWRTGLILATLCLSLGCNVQVDRRLAAAGERGGRPDASWRQADLWDDGLAEFSAYGVTWRRYGHLYDGTALMILVKEPWAPELNVKADRSRPDGFDVLKLNHVRDVATGIYTYHQTASVFSRRDDGQLVKIAATSSESCGISTALMQDGQLELRSYFDGQPHQVRDYPAHAVPQDGLASLLRDYVAGDPPDDIEVVPSLLMGRFGDLQPRVYGIEKKDAEPVTVNAGTFETVVLTLRHDEHWLEFAFAKAPPHVLVRLRQSNDTEYRLLKSERLAYWAQHDPGGESWYPKSWP